MKNNPLLRRVLASAIGGSLLTAIAYYVALPAINVHSKGFWVFLLFVLAFYTVPVLILSIREKERSLFGANGKTGTPQFTVNAETVKAWKIPLVLAAVPLSVLLVGSVISAPMFNASAYANIISVTEAVFEEDMRESNEVTNIALMDSASAELLGKNTLGKLSDRVSQYEIASRYSQINFQNTPKKVANLEYADFFKWLNNRDSGIPGYVMVDPVNPKLNAAEYVELSEPLRYVSSGFFGDNLTRKLRMDYPTKIFDYISFEIDEDGKPFYIVSCLTARTMLFGAMDVNEVIIFDPCTGDSQLYEVAQTPSWVDTVYSGDLAEQKYNWHGMLSGGYLNSIIGNVGCKQTTDDYGYITIDDDVWYFTGVTSVTADESNIGFILSNARTGEYKYYSVIGAEEYSAMEAAQGQVQHMRYTASFPSLVNIQGEASYIMVLKDSSGYVKQFALVNVENVNIVATGDTQAEAVRAYKALLQANGLTAAPEEPAEEVFTAAFTVLAVRDVVVDGQTVVYLTGDDGNTYKCAVAENEEILLFGVGQRVSVQYTATAVPAIRAVRAIRSID